MIVNWPTFLQRIRHDSAVSSTLRCRRQVDTAHKYGNLYSHMKATIELPDDLFVAAKKRAAGERRPLRELVEEALRARLAQRAPVNRRSKPIHWVTAPGGLPQGMDVSDRASMHDWLQRHR